MARSMTGFGRGESTSDWGRIVVEMKAVNHRFSEIVFRMPRQFSTLEEQARRLVLEQVARGRVDVFVTWTPSARTKSVQVDKDLAMAYYYALKELGEEIGSNLELTADTFVRLPDVFTVAEAELTAEELWPPFAEALSCALSGLVSMREREGAALADDLLSRIERIEQLRNQIAQRAPLVVEEYRAKLTRRLEELLPPSTGIDPQRLAQEVAFFADRADISEELQRLASHMVQFRSTLAGGGPVGRKLDFLVQELGREINTIGSKANDAAITNLVVEAKSELEKVREQVQNME